jgi:hypothetical protein
MSGTIIMAEWYRRKTWAEADEEEFLKKLGRAKRDGRAQIENSGNGIKPLVNESFREYIKQIRATSRFEPSFIVPDQLACLVYVALLC